MCNVRKKLFAKAKKKNGHKTILSACKTGIQGTGKVEERKVRKNKEYKEEYCRKSRSNVIVLDSSESNESCYDREDVSISSESDEDRKPPAKRKLSRAGDELEEDRKPPAKRKSTTAAIETELDEKRSPRKKNRPRSEPNKGNKHTKHANDESDDDKLPLANRKNRRKSAPVSFDTD